MPGTRDVRHRLLEATVDLLREGGLHAASPAAVADRAGAGKMSLYRHFDGKDDLLGEALSDYDVPHRARLLSTDPEVAPADRLLGMFDRAAARAGSPDFTGCVFVSTRLELHDRTHPAARAAAVHKQAMVEEVARILAELGVPDPERAARMVMILMDGALVHAVITGSSEPLLLARSAVEAMLPGGSASPEGAPRSSGGDAAGGSGA